MTTLELIEKGIGHNCLSDAYDLGRADQKAEDEKIIEDLKYCNAHIPNIEQIKADVIDECLVLVDKIMPPQPYLLKSKHYENWKIKTTELRMLRDMLEQLKSQK